MILGFGLPRCLESPDFREVAEACKLSTGLRLASCDDILDRYDFHGVALEIRGSRNVIDALQPRLGRLPRSPTAPSDLVFEFRTIQPGVSNSWERPGGSFRTIYELPSGEALYFTQADQLYLGLGQRVKVLADFKAGKTCFDMHEPEEEQLWPATRLLFTISLIEQLKRRALFNVHAAALACNGRSILLPGASGSGKSTLAVAMLQAGMDYVADDMVFLRRSSVGLQTLAFPEDLDLTADSISFFEELKRLHHGTSRNLLTKSSISIDSLSSAKVAWESHPVAIVFPRVATITESRLQPIPPSEAFLELAGSVLLTDAAACQQHIALLSELVEATRNYRLDTGRDFHRFPSLINNLLTS